MAPDSFTMPAGGMTELGQGRVDNDSARRNETQKERIDRELVELLQELRVAIPGVQVLFAFLLTIPFSQRFAQLDSLERYVYFSSLLCAAAATALLISPTSYHRIRFREHEKERMLFTSTFREHEKERMLFTSTRLAIAGLFLLAAAIGRAVFVIAATMFGRAPGAAIAAAVAAWFGWFWYGLPLSRKLGKR